MYNRYIRGENGTYSRVPQEDPHQPPKQKPETHRPPPKPEAPQPKPEQKPPSDGKSGQITDGLTGFLRHFLDQLHLDHVDTGDLLLLILLFFLFREDADEELLVALGLLLIL